VAQSRSSISLPQTGGATAVALEHERALLGAWRRIRSVDAQLAAVPAPAPADHLRALLLQLTGLQADLTLQTARLQAFLPQFSQALKPLGPATVRLERVLTVNQAYGSTAVAQVYTQKAQALRTFRSVVGSIKARLVGLTPPRVLAPQYHTEFSSLDEMGSSAGQLATALDSGQPGNVAPLLRKFDNAAAAPHGQSLQRAQVTAIKAYDRQVAQVNQLAADVQRERLRLANTLR
jgi:hypothetical protein